MSFTISNQALSSVMRQVCQIVMEREQASILGHVLLEGGKEDIRFTTVNEDTQITTRVSCNPDEKFTRTLPARRLDNICKNLPGDAELQFQFQKDKAKLKDSTGSSQYMLNCLPAEEFYKINLEEGDEDTSEASPLNVSRSDFLHLISKTQTCMGQADVRQYLNGVLLDISSDNLRMVATDGNRMAVCDRPLKEGGYERQAILSRRVVERLPRILSGKTDEENDDVSIFVGSNFMRLKWCDISISTRLVKGQYPDYQAAMPKAAAEDQIIMPYAEFLASLHKVDSIMSTQSRGIRMSLSESGVNLSAHNSLGEKAEDSFPLPDRYDGPKVNMAFNVDFMFKVLEGLSDEDNIRLFIRDPVSSFLILPKKGQDIQYVIMPMRL